MKNQQLYFSVILYAITAVYFAGVMVRLLLTLTPVVCILSGIAFSYTYERYLVDEGGQSKRFIFADLQLFLIFASLLVKCKPVEKFIK